MYYTENIKNLYQEIEDKTKFIAAVSVEFDREPRTLQNHWFSGFFSVPKKLRVQLIEFMQNYLKIQNGLVAENI